MRARGSASPAPAPAPSTTTTTAAKQWELFDPPAMEAPSPRLAWMSRHGIDTERIPGLERPWTAFFPRYGIASRVGRGATEEEALLDLAEQVRLRDWR